MKCIRCGSEVSMSSKFCKSCGTVVSKETVIEEVDSQKAKIPGKALVLVAGLVLLIIVCSKMFAGTEMNQDILDNSYESASENMTDEESWNEYVLPESDSRYLTKEELYGLSAEQCRIARNEIYARHGRMFNDAGLQSYFESFDWYAPTISPDDFQESVLNEYEMANRDLIIAYEVEQGY